MFYICQSLRSSNSQVWHHIDFPYSHFPYWHTTDFYMSSALAMKICGCIVFSDLYWQPEDCNSALLNKLHIYIKISTILYLMPYNSAQQLLQHTIFFCICSVLLSLGLIFFLWLTEHISSTTISFYLRQCNSSRKEVISEVLKKVVLDVSLIKPWMISHVWDAILDITAGHITRSLEDFIGALTFDTDHAVAEQGFTCEILWRHIVMDLIAHSRLPYLFTDLCPVLPRQHLAAHALQV